MLHVAKYFEQAQQITSTIDCQAVESMAEALAALREKGGRLFFIDAGGSAGASTIPTYRPRFLR